MEDCWQLQEPDPIYSGAIVVGGEGWQWRTGLDPSYNRQGRDRQLRSWEWAWGRAVPGKIPMEASAGVGGEGWVPAKDQRILACHVSRWGGGSLGSEAFAGYGAVGFCLNRLSRILAEVGLLVDMPKGGAELGSGESHRSVVKQRILVSGLWRALLCSRTLPCPFSSVVFTWKQFRNFSSSFWSLAFLRGPVVL